MAVVRRRDELQAHRLRGAPAHAPLPPRAPRARDDRLALRPPRGGRRGRSRVCRVGRAAAVGRGRFSDAERAAPTTGAVGGVAETARAAPLPFRVAEQRVFNPGRRLLGDLRRLGPPGGHRVRRPGDEGRAVPLRDVSSVLRAGPRAGALGVGAHVRLEDLDHRGGRLLHHLVRHDRLRAVGAQAQRRVGRRGAAGLRSVGGRLVDRVADVVARAPGLRRRVHPQRDPLRRARVVGAGTSAHGARGRAHRGPGRLHVRRDVRLRPRRHHGPARVVRVARDARLRPQPVPHF
mmetsp:Transcript_7993/g.25141  ORF Transcript_7993/g.25141 Transcript_7993/m.25141 type:complete len:291 (+) Transcript_7993:416-1288(+)